MLWNENSVSYKGRRYCRMWFGFTILFILSNGNSKRASLQLTLDYLMWILAMYLLNLRYHYLDFVLGFLMLILENYRLDLQHHQLEKGLLNLQNCHLALVFLMLILQNYHRRQLLLYLQNCHLIHGLFSLFLYFSLPLPTLFLYPHQGAWPLNCTRIHHRCGFESSPGDLQQQHYKKATFEIDVPLMTRSMGEYISSILSLFLLGTKRSLVVSKSPNENNC